ncbi:hypothetical protein CKO51_20190 [Rhodopirellula sp. SM50]|nr:hypothetical protein CKO51_20190 [Rhodopirellula sp. SM50]
MLTVKFNRQSASIFICTDGLGLKASSVHSPTAQRSNAEGHQQNAREAKLHSGWLRSMSGKATDRTRCSLCVRARLSLRF